MSSPPHDNGAPQEKHCPKCSAIRQGGSCPQCGLVFELFDEAVLLEGVPSDVISLWSQVEQQWSNRAIHALFIERAVAAQVLGFAAGCYRRKAADPIAEERLVDVIKRAEGLLQPLNKQPGTPRGRWLIALLFLLMIAALFFLLVTYGP